MALCGEWRPAGRGVRASLTGGAAPCVPRRAHAHSSLRPAFRHRSCTASGLYASPFFPAHSFRGLPFLLAFLPSLPSGLASFSSCSPLHSQPYLTQTPPGQTSPRRYRVTRAYPQLRPPCPRHLRSPPPTPRIQPPHCALAPFFALPGGGPPFVLGCFPCCHSRHRLVFPGALQQGDVPCTGSLPRCLDFPTRICLPYQTPCLLRMQPSSVLSVPRHSPGSEQAYTHVFKNE